jgi:hypothetical protein
MDEIARFGKQLLDETVAKLKGEYAAIPQAVKDVMPEAALLVARGAVGGVLGEGEKADLRHAMAIMANVKVGGQIALNELMLSTAANILAAGIGFIRKIIGI